MYRFNGVTESYEFSLYVDQPKEKSILIRLILITILVTGFFSFAILMCNGDYLLLLQERIAGEHKVFEEGMDLFSSSGLFEGIRATYESATGKTSYITIYGGVPEDYKPKTCPSWCVTVWNECIRLGGTAEFAAAVIGNGMNEGGPTSNSGNVVGTYQFTNGRAESYVKWCNKTDHSGHTKLKCNYGDFCTSAKCQTYYFIEKYALNDHISHTFKSRVQSGLLQKVNKTRFDKSIPSIDTPVPETRDAAKKCTDIKMATLKLYVDWETAGASKFFWNVSGCGTAAEAAKFFDTSNSSYFYDRCMDAHKVYKEFTKVATTIQVVADDSSSSASGGWKYMPTSWISKANIDTSKLSAKRQTVIDCMYWIVWNCYYSWGGLGGSKDKSRPRITNFNTLLTMLENPIVKDAEPGADCSSSVYAAYKEIGVTVPYTAGDYSKMTGKKIDKDDLAPGDLLATDTHVVMFLGWIDKSAGKCYCAAMHTWYFSGTTTERKPWKDSQDAESHSGDFYMDNVSGYSAAYRFTPVGTGLSSSTSSTSASGTTSTVTTIQSDSTLLIGNQIVVSACKQLDITVKGSGSAEYVNGEKDSNWIYFGKEHTGYSYLNSKKDILTEALEKGMPLIILTGTNDTSKASKISELANSLGSKGLVYVCTLPPVNVSCQSVSNSDITSFNKTIKTGAQKYKILDLHSYCSIEGIKSSDGSTNYSKSDALKMLKWIKEQVRR